MAGSSKAELLLALTAMFAAIVGLVVARLVPSVHVVTPVVVVQGARTRAGALGPVQALHLLLSVGSGLHAPRRIAHLIRIGSDPRRSAQGGSLL